MIGLDTPADTAGTSALGRSSHPEQQTQSSGLQGSVSASSRRAATPHQQQLRPVAEDSRGGLPAVGGTVSGPPAGFDAPGDPCPVGSLGLRARSSGNAGSVSAASTTAELRTHSGAATGMVAYRNNGVERTTGGNGANRQGPDPDLSANPGPGGSQHARNNGMAAAAIGGPTRQAVTTINQLHKASVVGDLIAISRFIREGGNLEAQSFCGRTALHYAAFYGHADVARALIIGGANVCSRGGGNSTPLHFAAWGGNKGVVRLLLDYGADVEAHDTEGNAPQARDAVAHFSTGQPCLFDTLAARRYWCNAVSDIGNGPSHVGFRGCCMCWAC